VPARRPLRRLRTSRSSRDRRHSASVKRPSEWTIRGAFLRQDVRATGHFVDPVPRLATRSPRERPRGGPTISRFVVESAGASTFRCPSWNTTLDLAPAHRRAIVAARRRQGPLSGFSELRDCATDLCNASSTRGHAREPGILLRAGPSPLSAFAARRLPALQTLRWYPASRGHRGARHLVLPRQVFWSWLEFYPLARARPVKAVRWRRGAMPSVDPLRVPLAGASPLSRRGRRARWHAASVEGGSSRHCCLERHGPSSAE